MKKSIIAIAFIFLTFFSMSGCGPAVQMAIGGASILLSTANDGGAANNSFEVPASGTSLREVIAKCGQPDFVVNVDDNKTVLYYELGNDTTAMLAVVDGVYREHFFASTKSVEEYRQKGALKNGARKIFKSFQDNLTSTSVP